MSSAAEEGTTNKSGGGAMGPMCIFMKEHGKLVCENLQMLRMQTGLVDLDIICEETHIHVHKVVMAACSKFFKEQLCKANVLVPVILKLEDFGLELSREAVGYLIEFVYRGEVVIPGDSLADVCDAAHSLGIYGLVEFLPTSRFNKRTRKDNTPAAAAAADQSAAEASTSQEEMVIMDQDQQQQPLVELQQQEQQQVHQQVNQQEHHQQEHQQYQQDQQNLAPYSCSNSVQDVMLQHPLVEDIQSTLNMSESNHHYSSSEYKSSFASYNYNNVPYVDLTSSSGADHNSRGKLRIINQQGIITNTTANIQSSPGVEHLSSSSKNAAAYESQWAAAATSVVVAPYDAVSGTLEESQQEVTLAGGTWYLPTSSSNNMNYSENSSHEGAWTTPAAADWQQQSTAAVEQQQAWPTSAAAPAAPTEPVNPPIQQQGTATAEAAASADPEPVDTPNNKAGGAAKDKILAAAAESGSMLAIRSGVPLALQGKKRKRNSNNNNKKRPELEVRKDLTLPTAPTAGEDNVFQPDDNGNNVPAVVVEINEDGEDQNHMEVRVTSVEEKTKFECIDCAMNFINASQLRSHVKHAHGKEDMLCCPFCKEYGREGKENLKIHLYKQHGIGEFFRCEECNYETSIKSSFVKHVAAHAENQMVCNKCQKSFKSRSGLKLHLQKHYEDDLHKCTVCDFKTPQKANLIKHLATKHKKGQDGEDLKMNKACELCSFVCVADHLLKAHMLRKHTSKDHMKFKCTHCDYASVERAALNKHVRFKHTNERPFLCGVCGFSTHTHSAMSRHKRGHSQAKPYVCDTCGAAYADRKRLRDHQLAHTGSLPFDCDFCGFSSRRKDNLQAHIRRLHPDLIKTTSSSKKSQLDKSHIVGHINQDGSIRPVMMPANEEESQENCRMNFYTQKDHQTSGESQKEAV